VGYALGDREARRGPIRDSRVDRAPQWSTHMGSRPLIELDSMSSIVRLECFDHGRAAQPAAGDDSLSDVSPRPAVGELSELGPAQS
jgi:hypothetical protein